MEKALEVGYHERDSSEPASEEAHQWSGWGTALKPAWEPIILARKPLDGTVAANVLRHGTGALSIDECRIPGTGGRERNGEASQDRRYTERGGTNFAMKPGPRGGSPDGRWPANLLLDEEAAAALDEQTGTLTSGKAAPGGHRRNSDKFRNAYGEFAGQLVESSTLYGDSGGASRFFYCSKASKADRGEGNGHATVKPTDLMTYLVRLVTPRGGLVLDPFCGSGSTGLGCLNVGARFVGIEKEPEYCEIARGRLRGAMPLFNLAG